MLIFSAFQWNWNSMVQHDMENLVCFPWLLNNQDKIIIEIHSPLSYFSILWKSAWFWPCLVPNSNYQEKIMKKVKLNYKMVCFFSYHVSPSAWFLQILTLKYTDQIQKMFIMICHEWKPSLKPCENFTQHHWCVLVFRYWCKLVWQNRQSLGSQ